MQFSSHTIKKESAWFLLRCVIRQKLGWGNRAIQTYRKDSVSHVDLEQDIRLLIPNPRPLLLDVGANKGQTISMFRRIFGRPIIHAFEPNKSLCEASLASLKNEDLILNAAALGEREGSLPFHEHVDSKLSSLLEMDAHEQNPFKGSQEQATSRVPVWKLDQYLATHKLGPVDLLKIDTQGYDLKVLQGAQQQLEARRIAFVMLEINFVPMYKGQPTFGEIDAFLRGHNYALLDMYEKVYEDNHLAWCTGLYQRI